MKSLLFTILICSLAAPFSVLSQVSIEWQRTLGGSIFDEVYDVDAAPDGNYFVTGRTASSDFDIFGYHGGYDIFVAKLNIYGSVLWKKTIGGSNVDVSYTVLALEDGGCIIGGTTRSDNHDVVGFHGGLGDGWVFRLSSSGNFVWQKTYGGIDMENINHTISTSDGGYLMVGSSSIPNGDVTENLGGIDYWVIKTDEVGNVIWQHSYGGSSEDIAYYASETSDGGYIVTGNTFSNDGFVTNNKGNIDIWTLKLTVDGQFEWGISLGGEGAEFATFVQETDDGYIIGGMTGSSDNGDVQGYHGNLDIWAVKINLEREIVWQRPIGGSNPDHAGQFVLLDDGSCIIVGEVQSNDGDIEDNNGGADLALVKVSPDGELLWQQTFGGTQPEFGYAIDRTSDNGFIVGGYAWSTNGDLAGMTNRGKNDFWILKLSPETISAAEAAAADPILLYPNPATDAVTISVPEPFSELQIIITDASGIVVLQKDVINGSTLPLTGLPAGVYTLQARMPDGRVRTGKMGKF